MIKSSKSQQNTRDAELGAGARQSLAGGRLIFRQMIDLMAE
jgi:hypothetical protein